MKKIKRLRICIVFALIFCTVFSHMLNVSALEFNIDDELYIINTDYVNSSVQTWKGNTVETIMPVSEFPARVKEYLRERSPSYVTVVRDASLKYNCHSYAWYSTASNNPHWINHPGAFLNDGTYIQSNWKAGDIIVYYQNGNVVHSGIITQKNSNTISGITVVSKWGYNPLYSHRGDLCPYYDDNSSCTVVVYRVCKHSSSYHNYSTNSVATHSLSCSVCGHLLSEPHTFNHLSRCIKCGYVGHNVEINKHIVEVPQ